MKNKKTVALIRLITQISVFVLVFLIAVGKWLTETGVALPVSSDVSLHAMCPFGGVVTVYQFASTGDFIQKIHSSAFLLMILGLIVALLFGAIFCGYLCPFGAVQEWIGKLGKKLFPKKYNHMIPFKIDRVLRYLRYIVLGMVVYQTAVTAKLVFQDVDPYYALFNFFTDEVAITAYVILGVTLVASLFIERPWCKYLCPYGALLGLFNPIRIFKIRRNPQSCTQCKRCDHACPMNITVSNQTVIRDHQCIACHRCTSEEACPIQDTVFLSVNKGGAPHEN